ncbi:LOW QUALITY PROTEIN: cilia- and flagella-associated protein 65-like [Lytechinus variegatus]|uniref:LOW QUALITY PROTEIN: cilia- and flagella-associated protein 65-like n=1 Tax=Lytechinus variegatus TaxID=7654 RepID=UPI001BB2CA1E|nr:LOW QUALITY PROTEIN: cilia- and flagella-associated protein 65-like [Lytechinus variegatus]
MPVAVPRRSSSNVQHKTNHFGIEVVKGLTWKGWEPGGEYTKHVILKNVQVKTQKLKFSSPNTRFFSTLYPEPIVLSAGTSYSLPVTFRPLEKNIYVDKIEFQAQDGVFQVPMQAVLPKHELSLPNHLNFGMCATKDFTKLTFELSNTSELVTNYAWSVSLPFVLEPSTGTLEPKSKCTITTTFKPTSAVVYETVAEVHYGSDSLSCKKTLKLEGIGKLPHLLVAQAGRHPRAMENLNIESVVSFGDVSIGSTAEKWIELHNLAPVNSPFTVDHPTATTRIDTVFSCQQKSGTVPPESISRIPVSFTPNTVNEESVDYLHIQAIGKVSKTIVKLHGRCKGPVVTLGSQVLNFGLLNLGDSATRTLDIINQSDVAAYYQFMIDGEQSVFELSVQCGKVEPHTTQTLIITFTPSHPINHYRRVTCLVQNQDPLFVDMIGTCHTELCKPAVLQPIHLTRYRQHVAGGFSVFPPEHLNEMVKDGKLALDSNRCLTHPSAEAVDDLVQKPTPLPPMKEYFDDGRHGEYTQPVHVTIDTTHVDFGNVQDLRRPLQKTLNVTNHTKGKITVTWMGDENHIYSISPVSSDIPPLKMTSFRVTFKPNAPNQFFGAELEGYAFYKSMRDYRLVQDETFCPPWCLTVAAVGQTFQPNNETFLPRYTLDTKKLVFPAVDIGDSIYKTLLLSNAGTTPIHFTIPDDPSGTFKVKPSSGLLRDKHQLFVFKVIPKVKDKTLRHQFRCRLNDSDKHIQEIDCLGSSEQPRVLLDTEGVLYFKSTCIGTSSRRSYKVKNTSRIALKYQWKVPHAQKDRLSVYPITGIILPNETQSHVWTFTPSEEIKYVIKPSMYVEDINHIGDLTRRKAFLLRVLGEGSIGRIKCEDPVVDLSDVVVNTAVTRDIVLHNNSNCSLHYELSVEQTMQGSYAEEAQETDDLALTLDRTRDILPARSRRVIRATIRPERRLGYTFFVGYRLLTPSIPDLERTQKKDEENEGKEEEKKDGEKKEEEAKSVSESEEGPLVPVSDTVHQLCEMTAVGVYPTLQITDARCYGSAAGISKARLWSLLSLDNLNSCLDSDPSPVELIFSRVTKHNMRRKAVVLTQALLDFNFSASPVGAEPCIVHLMLENTGTVNADWAYLFPTDLQLEMEYWAETGEFDNDELHEMRIMDNKLFTVEPSSGSLMPGQCQTVTLTYCHEFAGTDRLPVLFKIMRGREVLLNFTGVTVSQDRRYVHFPSNKHMFSPVPIGGVINPKQVYELYNGGGMEVMYQLDLTALEQIQEENFNHRIFDCLNPKGVIPAGRTAKVEWIFSPLEAKTYMVDVPIHIIGGDTALITFTGVGYDKRNLGTTMPMTDGTELTGVPSVQSIPLNEQLLYASEERVAFGNLPLFSEQRKVVYLTNRSPSHTVSFEWYVTSEDDSQVLDIQPPQGTLHPGEGCMCKVVFTAIGEPSFYDLDVICEVADETIMAEYRKELQDWEAEKERQKYEFTITEFRDDTKTDGSSAGPEGRSRFKRERTNSPVPPEEFKRYQTLPPIKNVLNEKELNEKHAREHSAKDGSKLWPKPEKPDTFVMHLGVTARTHTIAEFQSNFPNEVQKFFIDRGMSERMVTSGKGKRSQRDESMEPEDCDEMEAGVVGEVMSTIVRALLDDHDFHEALRDIPNEPIPYFTQFGDRPQSLSRMEDLKITSPPPSQAQPHEAMESPTKTVQIEMESRGVRTPESTAYGVPSRTIMHDSVTEQPPSAPTGEDVGLMPSRSVLQSSPGIHTEYDYQISLREEKERLQQQNLKRLPEFASTVESTLDNTLFNIMMEAFGGEINLTARPRLIALPPSTPPRTPPTAPGAKPKQASVMGTCTRPGSGKTSKGERPSSGGKERLVDTPKVSVEMVGSTGRRGSYTSQVTAK